MIMSSPQEKIALILMAAMAVVVILSADFTASETTFSQWQAQYGQQKHISSEELHYRQQVFKQNLRTIQTHNSNPNRTYDMGLNQFSDLTPLQFRELYLHQHEFKPQEQHEMVPTSAQNELDVDWVKKGVVTKVRNQGLCKADYAIAGIGAVESLYALNQSSLVEFSPQKIIDCRTYETRGCYGGPLQPVFRFAIFPGVQFEEKYPFTGTDGECKDTSSWGTSGYGKILACEGLYFIIKVRPVAVTIVGDALQNYKRGIVYCSQGGSYAVSMLMVAANQDFFRLRGSFGATWGEQGFMRIANNGNNCRVCQEAFYPH